MKTLIIGVLLVFGINAQAADKEAPFQKCMCNFNACLGAKTKKCVQVIRCKNTTASDYADNVGNRKTLLVLSDKAYCWNPYAQ